MLSESYQGGERNTLASKHVQFGRVVIKRVGDKICASLIGDDSGTLYNVHADEPFIHFLIDGVVACACIIGQDAFIVRTMEESVDLWPNFAPEYVARISGDESNVLILRPVDGEEVWVSSKNFARYIKRIKSVLNDCGLYMLKAYNSKGNTKKSNQRGRRRSREA
jgi:hypothetical protein